MKKFTGSFAVLALFLGACASPKDADTPPAAGAVANVGAPAPSFSLPDQDGKTVSLKDYAGKVVVVEWTNPGCPFVQARYKQKEIQNLESKYADKGVAWVAINSTKDVTDASNKKWAADQGVAYPILNDVGTQAGKAYGATNTPEIFIVGKDGKLLYKGGLDNDDSVDSEKPAKINYVQNALDEILAGKPVSTPETKAYGCGVHYAN